MHIRLLIILLLLPFLILAQNRNQFLIDSIGKAPSIQREDTIAVKLLNRMAYLYNSQSNSDSVIKYAQMALNLASRLNFKLGVGDASTTLANCYDELGKFPEALKYDQQALKIRLALGDKKKIGGSYCNIGNIYREQFNFPLAQENYFKAIKVLEEAGSKDFLANTYYGLGVLYTNWGNFPEALKSHMMALKLREGIGNKDGIAYSKSCICDVHLASGDFSKATADCFKGVLKYEEENGLKYSITWAYLGLARTYKGSGDYPKALKNSVAALKFAEEYHLFQAIILANTEIGQIYVLQKKYEEAEVYANKALKMAEQLHSPKDIEINRQTIAELTERTGKFERALENYKAFIKVRDSLVNKDNIEQVAQAKMQFEFDKKDAAAKVEQEKKNAQAAITLNKQKTLRNSFICGFAALLFFSVSVVRNSKRQKRTNKLLSKEKLRSDGLLQTLQESLMQKELLMKEIHHRVKNNLQVISALLELQLENVSDVYAIDAMTESTTRVRSISLIHQQLYQDEELTSIEISKFVRDLFQQVSIVFKKNNNTVILDSMVQESHQDIDTAVPLGLILNELMTNSYKYAFTSSNTGSINIDLEQADGFYTLKYKDSGPGLPPGFNMDLQKSLGMRVIRNLSKQIGGKFQYDFESKTFIVTFKNITERKKIA